MNDAKTQANSPKPSPLFAILERRLTALQAKTGTSHTAMSCLIKGDIDRLYKEGLINDLEKQAYLARAIASPQPNRVGDIHEAF